MRTTTSLSLVAVLLSGVAQAADAKKPDAHPCSQAKNQMELNVCAATRADEAEAELETALKVLLAANKDDAVAVVKLQSAQRAWRAFRDAELESLFPLAPKEEARVKYGSIYPTCLAQAKEALARKRTAELKARANRVEGDVCP